jgi:hypothetical protein
MTDNPRIIEAEFLIGKKLVNVRPLTELELAMRGWDEIPQGEYAYAFIFEGGPVVIFSDLAGLMPGSASYSREIDEDSL